MNKGVNPVFFVWGFFIYVDFLQFQLDFGWYMLDYGVSPPPLQPQTYFGLIRFACRRIGQERLPLFPGGASTRHLHNHMMFCLHPVACNMMAASFAAHHIIFCHLFVSFFPLCGWGEMGLS